MENLEFVGVTLFSGIISLGILAVSIYFIIILIQLIGNANKALKLYIQNNSGL